MNPREIAIGDVHGCFEDLVALLETIGPLQEEDSLVFLGDLFDRGPDSSGVFELIRAMQESLGQKMKVLRGNHEDLLFDFLGLDSAGEYSKSDFERNGGYSTLRSFGSEKLLKEAGVWLSGNVIMQHETSVATYVHAGLVPNNGSSPDMERLWMRDVPELYELEQYKHPKVLVVGHTPVNNPPVVIKSYNLVMIDGGCAYGYYPLTAYDVKNRVAYASDGSIRYLEE